MSFLWPIGLVAILLVPLGLVLGRAIEQRRRRRLVGLGGLGLPSAAAASGGAGASIGRRATGLRYRIPAALFVIGFLVLGVASARPEASVSLPQVEGTVILAFDVSASMSADDLKPTRMDAAKAAAKDFVSHAPPGVVIGIVAFSDAGVAVQVPTSDEVALLASIDRLNPAHGTSLGQGILAALAAVAHAESGTPPDYYSNRSPDPNPTTPPVAPGSHDSAVVVLFTDGENNESPDPIAAAQTAADSGIRIDTVGIGSAAGTTVDLDGFKVHTQLDAATLQQVSQITKGTYYGADEVTSLRSIYSDVGSLLVTKSREIEVTGLLAGGAAVLFLAGALLSFAWLGRLP
jgi:Ca-activated chloride channel family protein